MQIKTEREMRKDGNVNEKKEKDVYRSAGK